MTMGASYGPQPTAATVSRRFLVCIVQTQFGMFEFSQASGGPSPVQVRARMSA
jgi:hypothetical protein